MSILEHVIDLTCALAHVEASTVHVRIGRVDIPIRRYAAAAIVGNDEAGWATGESAEAALSELKAHLARRVLEQHALDGGAGRT